MPPSEYKKRPIREDRPFFILKPDDDLLSHGEAPHYHRRYVVSLLSSVRDQVVPTFYYRQDKLVHLLFVSKLDKSFVF